MQCNYIYIFVSGQTQTKEKLTVPGGVTSLRAVVLVMSDNLGLGFTPLSQTVTQYTLYGCIHDSYACTNDCFLNERLVVEKRM